MQTAGRTVCGLRSAPDVGAERHVLLDQFSPAKRPSKRVIRDHQLLFSSNLPVNLNPPWPLYENCYELLVNGYQDLIG
jgi:hypothetical protein